MSSDLEKIRKVLREVGPELRKKQNVVATGIGYKTVAGRTTSDLSIICSVEVKKPSSRLRERDLVPSYVQGIPTDVRPVGVLRAFQNPTERFRPAPGGVSIGHYRITAGTLGCLVVRDGQRYILSNNHVLANSNEAQTGDPVLQPGPHDGGTESRDRIAELSEFVPIHFEGDDGGGLPCRTARFVAAALNALAPLVGSRSRLRPYRVQQGSNTVDCAIARPLDPLDVEEKILQIGTITGIGEGGLGMQVQKSGRTTGLTNGVIEQVDVSARVSYGTNKIALFEDQLMAGAMSQGGDSGSVVLDENNNLVGLLFAGSETTTLINRIGNVFDALSLSLP
ncbi:hypothetical protein [Sinomicrobium weinanense]|uniref:Trypsin-like peptidase domain-containing protein n=1 Tax=Sinomicrobium weinanense TaxID=2842200 RepID=A0A926Q4H6_9FLAO|nr:hypothetical protein [Sinomicrobium weinanense]MBC9796900.1 hypothetical protein [Sinomicrobium weinanense]MBU3124208.1 S1 family peptidase [Sinomicrobium weinanense]